MSISETISLSITIGLGIISLILSVFAIWLSKVFSDNSNETLGTIKELIGDIRALSQVGLVHQRDFSSKMLDSILKRDPYGRNEEADLGQNVHTFQSIVEKQMKDLEKKISDTVEQKLQTIVKMQPTVAGDVAKAIQSVRDEIKAFSADAVASVQHTLSDELRGKLTAKIEFPAYLLVLAVIIKENCDSNNSLAAIAPKYYIPDGWDSAVNDWIEKDILVGTSESFKVNDKYRSQLDAWIARNWPTLIKLITYYRNTNAENRNIEKSRETTRDFVF